MEAPGILDIERVCGHCESFGRGRIIYGRSVKGKTVRIVHAQVIYRWARLKYAHCANIMDSW